ncbi:hypothetical protein CJF30_00003693 [Rutstroemia sp. NJR-2017a BBW]|nr:hypothetical protein CJF30_00003693 [Rutstroemia sp. NJR-2017a BBW]
MDIDTGKFRRTSGKSTCHTIPLSKGKRDGSWQPSAITCLPPDDSNILYDEVQSNLMGNGMISNSPTPHSAKPIAIPYLPNEIIHNIIYQSDDLRSVKNWALVSRAYNGIAERILWSNITINTAQFYDPSWPYEGQDPLQVFRNEVSNAALQRSPVNKILPFDREIPPVVSRLPLVKNIAFRTVWDIDSRDLPNGGVKEDEKILKIYEEICPAMQNLTTVRIDGDVTKKTWNLLLNLPSLRELRIWRTTTVDSQALIERSYPEEQVANFNHETKKTLLNDLVLDFRGLSRLRSFEIGLLSPLESAALGAAVRESNLETLHIAVTRDSKSFDNQGPHTLEKFWRGLVPVEIDETSPIVTDANYGFPASMREIVIEDDAHGTIAPPRIVRQSFHKCIKTLTRFYLDILDEPLLAALFKQLHFPSLTHLHLPWVESERHEFDHPRTMSKAIVAFIEEHSATLQSFQLLNAAEDNRLLKYENPINIAIRSWMSIKEIRLDSEHTGDHYSNVPRGQEWTRPADFLSVDGGGYWGDDLRRARLDRFDLTNFEFGFKSYRAWQNIKVLVLNPRLMWHYGLLPDPHDGSSIRLRALDRLHLLGMKHLAESECENKDLAERISRKMGPNLRVLSIRDCRFWIEGYGGKIWHLRDALRDPEQRRQIHHVLDERDWDFLSERNTTDTQEAANSAIFLRNDMYSPIHYHLDAIPRPSSPSILDDDDSMSESASEDEVENSETENDDEDGSEDGSEVDSDEEGDRTMTAPQALMTMEIDGPLQSLGITADTPMTD